MLTRCQKKYIPIKERIIGSIIKVGVLPQIGEENKKRTIINLAVQRNFKNSEGKYETDFFRCVLWNGLASSTKEYCHRGDILGIKGRIQNRSFVDENNTTKYLTEIIAEKVSFVTTKSKKTKEEETEDDYETIIECC